MKVIKNYGFCMAPAIAITKQIKGRTLFLKPSQVIKHFEAEGNFEGLELRKITGNGTRKMMIDIEIMIDEYFNQFEDFAGTKLA